uniref:BZIP domain-containing protein n=1 Tax=Clastoptera arizonana TaxID=38151 RepID=A0A1B6C925_9HEMI
MNFSSKDHSSHERKKQGKTMSLNLDSKSTGNGFIDDQTPTPVKFYRNCEAVGLIKDLNVFDVEFKKAMERGVKGNELYQDYNMSKSSTTDDTLHTPHIFPNINLSESVNCSLEDLPSSINSQSNSVIVDQGKLEGKLGVDTENIPIIRCIQYADEVNNENQQSLNSGHFFIQLFSDGNDTETSGIEKQSEPTQTQILEVFFENDEPPPKSTEEEGTIKDQEGSSYHSEARQKLTQLLKGKGATEKRQTKHLTTLKSIQEAPPQSTATDSANEVDEKRFLSLERNRLSAMRCRQRRKLKICNIEKRADYLNSANLQLQAEVTSLRTEVAHLKTLLLAHSNCSVTQAMSEGNIPIPISVMPIPAPVRPPRSSATITAMSNNSNDNSNLCQKTIKLSDKMMLQYVPTQQTKRSLTLEPDEKNNNQKKKLSTIKSVTTRSILRSAITPSIIQNNQRQNTTKIMSPALISDSSNTFITQSFESNKVQNIKTQVIQANPNLTFKRGI